MNFLLSAFRLVEGSMVFVTNVTALLVLDDVSSFLSDFEGVI